MQQTLLQLPLTLSKLRWAAYLQKPFAVFFPLDSLYKGLRATKQQLEQDQPIELIFITESAFKAVYSLGGLGLIMEVFNAHVQQVGSPCLRPVTAAPGLFPAARWRTGE